MEQHSVPLEVWESLCTKCGKCCAEKVEIDGTVYLTARYCRHFDPATKECRVYDRRFETEPDCRPVGEGIKTHLFPSDCPYVKDIPGYRGPVEHWNNDLIDAAIIDVLGVDAVPPRETFEV
jgi:hypothetical protein